MSEDKNGLMQNPSDGYRISIEDGIKKKVVQSQEELTKCEDGIAYLAAKGKHTKQLKRLETRRAEIIANIATLQSSRTSFQLASKEALNAVLGLEQHKIVQEIFSSSAR